MNTNQTDPSITNTSSTKTRTPTLIIVIDPGTSCTKSIYLKSRRGKLKHLISSPVVYSTSAIPQAEATYVKLPDEENYYLVGDSALQTKVCSSIRQLKSEHVTPKILGIIGQIAREESLPNQFKLKLTLLLPISEINDQEFVELELSEALTNFDYSGVSYQIEDSSIGFRPEGSGIHSYLSCAIDADTIKNQTYAYLMFGYRNTSLLLVENGRLNQRSSHSTDLGFYNYLDLVTEYSSGLYRQDVQKAIVSQAIYGAGENCEQVIKGFISQIRVEDLIRSTNKKHQERERTLISNAIERANTEYWHLLANWLREVLPSSSQLDRVIYCGGSVGFIESQIQDFFAQRTGELHNTDDMSLQMLKQLTLPAVSQDKFIEKNLPNRLVDAWGEMVRLANIKI